MPPLSSHQTYKLINHLNNATTLAYGKTSHKVSRQYLNQNNNMIMDIDNVDLKPKSKNEHKIVRELWDTAVDNKISASERNLKVQLLVSKLNTVLTKRLDRSKYFAFSMIKTHNIKSLSMERYDRNFDHLSANTTNITGNAKDKLFRFGTDSEFK